MFVPKSDASVQKLSHPVGTTIDRFLNEEKIEGHLSQLLRDLVLASKMINLEINRAGLSGIEEMVEYDNHAEKQRKMDLIAGIRFTRALTRGQQVCAILSGESEGILDTGVREGPFVVCLDPLDGSSNIDSNVSIGTLFSVYKRVSELGSVFTEKDFKQKGKEQIAAGYVLYGSSTMFVFTTGQGVNGFTYEPSMGEYFLSHAHMQQPEDGPYYSVNPSKWSSIQEGVRSYITDCRDKDLDNRYIGSLVGDFHRNLLKGGIYLYPKNSRYPEGKLRLQHECNPLAFIAEQAGGLATDGGQNILEINPEWPHQRTAFFTGSKRMMKELLESIRKK